MEQSLKDKLEYDESICLSKNHLMNDPELARMKSEIKRLEMRIFNDESKF
jgi:hypothetical protein